MERGWPHVVSVRDLMVRIDERGEAMTGDGQTSRARRPQASGDLMGHVISLSEAARAVPSRHREPVPEGGATISLFLGVRYERWGTPADVVKRGDGPGREPAITEPVSAQSEITTADVA